MKSLNLATLVLLGLICSIYCQPVKKNISNLEKNNNELWYIQNRACAHKYARQLIKCGKESHATLTRKEVYEFCLNQIKEKCKEEKEQQKIVLTGENLKERIKKLRQKLRSAW